MSEHAIRYATNNKFGRWSDEIGKPPYLSRTAHPLATHGRVARDPRPRPMFRDFFQLRGPYTIRRGLTMEFAEIADPSLGRPDFRYLEVFAHLASCAPLGHYADWRSAIPGGCELLNATSSINNAEVARISLGDWRKALDRRFRHAMFKRCVSKNVADWRESVGLVPGGKIKAPGPHVNPFSKSLRNPSLVEMGHRLDDLFFDAFDRPMAWSLNDCHPDAVWVTDVAIRFGRPGSRPDFWAEYSYRGESSSWGTVLAQWDAGEPLLSAVDRAHRGLMNLFDPEASPPIIQTWAAHGGKPAAAWASSEGEKVALADCDAEGAAR